jgi:hypothetical protein
VADLNRTPQWAWESGTGGDGVAYQNIFGSLNRLSVDNAFTLSTSSVPEPADAALVSGSLLLGLAKWRFNRRLGE